MIEDIKYVFNSFGLMGDVMKFVSFPDGLHQTDMKGCKNWFPVIKSIGPTLASSIFRQEACGEAFYEIDAQSMNFTLDIKLFGFARGCALQHGGSPCYQKRRSKRCRDCMGDRIRKT